MIYNLQLLRALAATGVVIYHMSSEAGLRLPIAVGSRGVDIFFVISGFIIAYIGSDSSPRDFFVRRLIRIVPLYWAASLVVFLIALIFPHLLRSTTSDWVHLASSLAFIPRFSSHADGMFPTLVLGWSLNFEMYFYIVFALSLAIVGRKAPLLSAVVIVSVVVAGNVFGTESDVVAFYSRPIALEFVFGMAAFYFVKMAERHKARLESKYWLKLLLILMSMVSLFLIMAFEAAERGLPRYLVAGIPSFSLVFSAVLVERLFAVRSSLPIVHLLGEASYIIYLLHPYIIYSVIRLFFRGAELNIIAVVGLMLFLLVLTCAISVAIHVYLERPTILWLRSRALPTRTHRE